MEDRTHKISRVQPGSIAEELEIEPGDVLLSINDSPIEDVFDYMYLTNDDYLVLLVRKSDGQEWELEIEKEFDEDLGIEFESSLMDDYRSCCNHCMFCFIDQMPPGMRETLYFKDDDSRLSFLQGNYITLTNMKDNDLERIIRYRLAPINISVHTTNPELRVRMLHNRFAGEALKKIDRLYHAELEMNGQIVLCKGVNDREELERTIGDLAGYLPYMQSLSVVPVGLTRYREGLVRLEPFEKEDAREVIAIIERWQQYCMERYGVHFVQASDEWYLTAELPLPEEERYDGYLQLENGVGMLRLLMNEFGQALKEAAGGLGEESAVSGQGARHSDAECTESEPNHPQSGAEQGIRHHITIATGVLAAEFMEQLAADFMRAFPGYRVDIAAIRNDFFGERITVSGLITGQDLIAQLKGRHLGEKIAIPANMIRSGEDVFLDDITISDVEKALQVPLDIVKSSGWDLLNAMLCR